MPPATASDEALDHQLAHEAQTAGTHGQTHRDFLLPAGRARHQQIGDVSAGDQKHQPDHGHQHPKGRFHKLPQHGPAAGAGQDIHGGPQKLLLGVRVGVGEFLLPNLHFEDGVEQRLERRFGLGDADAWFQARKYIHPSPPAAFQAVHLPTRSHRLFHHYGNADLRRETHFDAIEAGLAHADHGQRQSVDQQSLTQHAWIPMEALGPEIVVEHGDGMAVRDAVVIGSDQAANGGFDTQDFEIVAGHQFALQALALPAHSHAQRQGVAANHTAEDLVAIAEVLIQRVGNRGIAGVAAVEGPFPLELDELLGMCDRQPAQKHLVEQRENGRVRADAQSQREDGDGGKNRGLNKCSEGKAYVGEQITHVPELYAPEAPSVPVVFCWRCDVPVSGFETTIPKSDSSAEGYPLNSRSTSAYRASTVARLLASAATRRRGSVLDERTWIQPSGNISLRPSARSF